MRSLLLHHPVHPIAVKFGRHPFVSDMLFVTYVRDFVLFFILYFIGLTLIFTVFAKVTVWVCRRRLSWG